MPNAIGIAYTAKKIEKLLMPNNSNDTLIGLLFRLRNDNKNFDNEDYPFKISQLYFKAETGNDYIRFYEEELDLVELESSVDRYYTKVDEVLTSNGSINSDDYLQFIDQVFQLAYFDINELKVLIALSGELIISGAKMHPGFMAFPDEGSNDREHYGTLVAEIDRDQITIALVNGTPIQSLSDALPTAALAMPCPTHWEAGMNLQRYTKSMQKAYKKAFLKELKNNYKKRKKRRKKLARHLRSFNKCAWFVIIQNAWIRFLNRNTEVGLKPYNKPHKNKQLKKRNKRA